MAQRERDYVLGTHDAEIDRLRFQHEVWRDEVHAAWRSAGIGLGSTVADIGAGPGFAALDLARLVGPTGRVFAVERSVRFLQYLRGETRDGAYSNIDCIEADLMHAPLALTGLDAVWCRWVACFVPDVGMLVDRLAGCLRKGGTAIFHEYAVYGSYQLLPPEPKFRDFVDAVYESWREEGGEPDIALALPKLLAERGFSIRSARPVGLAALPNERLWHWPAGFVRTNVPRLLELGRRDAAWGAEVLAALERAERNPASIFLTPTVLEIIAEKI